MKTLPSVALGTWSWGTGFAGGDTVFGNHLSDTQMADVFTTAMSKGLNLWDTAAVYGMGSSEAALGTLVRQFPREDMILSTKFTPQIADEQSAQPVSDMLEASLGRLGVDAIDIYWIHNPLDVEKWTPGLIPLLQSGKVKRVGVSNHNLAQIRRANEILNASGYSLSAVQNHYSLLYPIALLKRPGSLIIADKITSRSLLTWSWSKARSVVVMIQIIPCLPGVAGPKVITQYCRR